MGEQIKFSLATTPVAQPRQKHSKWGNYIPKDHSIHQYKQDIATAFRLAYQGPLLTGPLAVTLHFCMPRPKAETRKTKPNPPYWHTSTPDGDNLCKAVFDALNKLAWKDDSQVAQVSINKWVAGDGDEPGVYVSIRSRQKMITTPPLYRE